MYTWHDGICSDMCFVQFSPHKGYKVGSFTLNSQLNSWISYMNSDSNFVNSILLTRAKSICLMLVFANLSTEDLPKNQPMSPIKRLAHSKWAQVLILLIGIMFTAMSSLETPLLNTGVRFWSSSRSAEAGHAHPHVHPSHSPKNTTVITATASRWCGFYLDSNNEQIGLKILSSCLRRAPNMIKIRE